MDRQLNAFHLSHGPESPEQPAAVNKDMVRTAVRLCGLGWSLIPLRRETKVPHVRWEEYQYRRPTVNEVGRWLVDTFPGSNYAVITGAISNIVVVEADDDEAMGLLNKFPPTPLRQVSRKGQHRVYGHPGVPVRNQTRCWVGGKQYKLDIKGDGGYFVGPGSTHPSGHVYTEIEPWTAEALARMPVFDPAWIDPRPVPPRRHSPLAPSHLPGREPGDIAVPSDARLKKAHHWLRTGWHDGPFLGTRQGENASGRCFWIACKLVQGFALTPDEALPLFAEWGRRADQLDEYGEWYPWDESQLYHKLADADRHEDRDGRPRGYMLGWVQPPADRTRLKNFVFASRL